ncbi:MAG: Hpt domain-containing protein [Polyangiaceae bacterium]
MNEDAIRRAMAELRAEFMLELPGRVERTVAAARRWLEHGEAADRALAAQLAHQLFGAAGTHDCPASADVARRIELFFSKGDAEIEGDEQRTELGGFLRELEESVAVESARAP